MPMVYTELYHILLFVCVTLLCSNLISVMFHVFCFIQSSHVFLCYSISVRVWSNHGAANVFFYQSLIMLFSH